MSVTVANTIQSTRVAELIPPRDPASRRPAGSDAAGFDRAYWTRHCEGFRVDGAGGRVGFVEEVEATRDRVVLRVRMGRLGSHVIEIPAAEIAFIVPRAQRVWLRTSEDLGEL